MGLAIATALIGVAGTAYGAYSQSQAAKKASEAAGGAQVAPGELGDVPQAALYQPLNFTQEQNAAIGSNLDNLERTKILMGQANPLITQDALNRIKKLVPSYTSSMAQMGNNTNALLGGRLPFDDLSDIVSDRAEMSGGLNIPGTAQGSTLKDLGISKLDAMKSGAGLLGQMVSMAETISPRASYLNPRDTMISPLDRIRLELEQAQLEQQSMQNYYNLDAAGNPTEAANAQIRIGNAASGGGARGGADLAGYASAAQQLIGAVGKQWNQPSQELRTATPGTDFYTNSGNGLGWTPKAETTGRTWNASGNTWA